MADQSDDVRIPRKVWNSVISILIGLMYWLMLQGYQWMIRVDKHLEASDRTAWEQAKDIQDLKDHPKQ